MRAEWATGTLVNVDTLQIFHTINGPELAEGVELKGVAVTAVCPAGCNHFLAYEVDFEAAFEAATSRLQAAGAPSHSLLVMFFHVGEHGHAGYVAQAEVAAKAWRGSVH